MQAGWSWLANPAVFRVNRLNAHSDHVCYPDPGEIKQGTSSLRQSLDGLWRFGWYPSPASSPENFWQEGFRDDRFTTIQVPGHMELQGFGQIQYINTLYPWDGHAALRPRKSTGKTVPWAVMSGASTWIRPCGGNGSVSASRGAEQALYVWLNGHFAGYAGDSFTPSEFELTPLPEGHREPPL